MDFIDRLKELQGDKSQVEFAAEIGLDQSILSRLYAREIGLGKKTAKLLCKRFPHLSLEIAAFLLRDNMQLRNGNAA